MSQIFPRVDSLCEAATGILDLVCWRIHFVSNIPASHEPYVLKVINGYRGSNVISELDD